MKTVKVTWSDGDTTITDINGTMEEIRAYYVGKWFNLGGVYNPVEDRMVQAVRVDDVTFDCPTCAYTHKADQKSGAVLCWHPAGEQYTKSDRELVTVCNGWKRKE